MSQIEIIKSTIIAKFQYIQKHIDGSETREMRIINTNCTDMQDAFAVAVKHGANPRKQILFSWS